MPNDANVLSFPDGAPVPSEPTPPPAPPPAEPVRRCVVVIDGQERVFVRPYRVTNVVVETAQARDKRLAAERLASKSTVGRGLLAAHIGEVCGRPWWRWRS